MRSDEAISFILLLVDHNISDIISTCPPKIQASLQTLPYQSLITTMDGRDVARGLVRALINQQIKRQLSVSLRHGFVFHLALTMICGRSMRSATTFSRSADRSAARTTSCSTRCD